MRVYNTFCMKRFELLFTFLQLPLDYLMLLLAGATAYSLRFTSFVTSIRPVVFANNLSWAKFFPIVLWVAIGWIAIFALSGLYSTNPNRKFAREVARIVLACSTGFAAITIYVFFTLQKFDSRFLVLGGWVCATTYVIAARFVLQLVKMLLYRSGVGLRHTVLIGADTTAHALREALHDAPRYGYEVVSTFDHFDETVAQKLAHQEIDELIFADPKSHIDDALSAIDFANDRHITFKYSADLFTTLSTNMSVSTVAGVPIIELTRTRLTGWGRIIKRCVDIVGSLFFLILLLPIYAVIALIILIETGRPVIYKNERVGQYGQNFITLKFRSMYQKDSTGSQFGTHGEIALAKEKELIAARSVKTGPVYKIMNDPRVTPFGSFIRRWSIDELPQFWNVLMGDMSLVGPRPHQPREVALYEKHHKILFSIKPGITGLAQISGRSNLTFEEEAKLDTFYIENWSLYMDIIIMLKTPFVVLRRKGAW